MCAAYIFQNPEAIEIKEEETVADNNMTYKFFTTNSGVAVSTHDVTVFTP
jgi:hypothetical protein